MTKSSREWTMPAFHGDDSMPFQEKFCLRCTAGQIAGRSPNSQILLIGLSVIIQESYCDDQIELTGRLRFRGQHNVSCWPHLNEILRMALSGR
jgi:hypothetical protein